MGRESGVGWIFSVLCSQSFYLYPIGCLNFEKMENGYEEEEGNEKVLIVFGYGFHRLRVVPVLVRLCVLIEK